MTVSGRTRAAQIVFPPRPDLMAPSIHPVRGFFCTFRTALREGDEVVLTIGGEPAASFTQHAADAAGAQDVVAFFDEPQGAIARRHVHFDGWIKVDRPTACLSFRVDGQQKTVEYRPRWDACLQLGTSRVVGFAVDHEVTTPGQTLMLDWTVDGRVADHREIETRPAGRRQPDQPLTLFMHIPKTAGTSLANAFRKQPGLESCWLYESPQQSFEEQVAALHDRVGGLDLVGGHFTYGLHRSFGRDCRYLTFFRQPEDLIFSFFNYMKRVVRHPAWTQIDFRQALQQQLDWHLDNPLTRYVAVVPPTSRVGADDARRASEILKRHFVVVGILDRMDESLLRVSERLGISLDVGRDNRTPANRRVEHDSAVERLLRPATEFDDKLYAEAQARL